MFPTTHGHHHRIEDWDVDDAEEIEEETAVEEIRQAVEEIRQAAEWQPLTELEANVERRRRRIRLQQQRAHRDRAWRRRRVRS